MKFFSCFFAVALAATSCLGATVADLQKDVTYINGNLTSFNAALKTFNASPGIVNAIPLATNTQSTYVAITALIAHTQALPKLTVLQAGALAPLITSFSINAAASLAAVVSAQATFTQIPLVGQLAVPVIGGLIAFFQGLSVVFGNAILAVIPPVAQGPFLLAQTTINTAFSAANKVFVIVA